MNFLGRFLLPTLPLQLELPPLINWSAIISSPIISPPVISSLESGLDVGNFLVYLNPPTREEQLFSASDEEFVQKWSRLQISREEQVQVGGLFALSNFKKILNEFR